MHTYIHTGSTAVGKHLLSLASGSVKRVSSACSCVDYCIHVCLYVAYVCVCMSADMYYTYMYVCMLVYVCIVY